jgi:protein-tyrosine phosphatase
MEERHPRWAGRVEFWHVHDVDFAPPEAALPEIEERVRELVARLAGEAGHR